MKHYKVHILQRNEQGDDVIYDLIWVTLVQGVNALEVTKQLQSIYQEPKFYVSVVKASIFEKFSNVFTNKIVNLVKNVTS